MDAAPRVSISLRDETARRVLAGGWAWRAEALAREALREAVSLDRAAARAASGCDARRAESPGLEPTDGGPLLDVLPSAIFGRPDRKADERTLALARVGAPIDRLPRLKVDRLAGGRDALPRIGGALAPPPPLGRVKVRGAERPRAADREAENELERGADCLNDWEERSVEDRLGLRAGIREALREKDLAGLREIDREGLRETERFDPRLIERAPPAADTRPLPPPGPLPAALDGRIATDPKTMAAARTLLILCVA
jgi:hypothetical protein